MISKCGIEMMEDMDEDLIKSCESPVMTDLESFLPVTDYMFHYTNKFCAVCNGVTGPNDIKHWSVEVYCNKTITFTYETLLSTVEREQCNLFFKPPNRVPVQNCNRLSYRISTCNETGLWRTYNKTIEYACNVFVDPFNSTYKNYFCYVCNALEPIPHDSWRCMDTLNSEDYVFPAFSFSATLDVLKQLKDDLLLECNTTQYQDYRKAGFLLLTYTVSHVTCTGKRP